MIELTDICKTHLPTYHGRAQKLMLDHVDLTINPDEKGSIFGHNGAGKSTLIRIISGSDKPHSGRANKTMTVSWPLAFSAPFQGSLTGRGNTKRISRSMVRTFTKPSRWWKTSPNWAPISPNIRNLHGH